MKLSRLANIAALLYSGFNLFTSTGKFTRHPEITGLLTSGNLGEWITLVGIGQAISAILFAIPATRKFGVLLFSSYWGGAIVTHMSHPDPVHQSFVGPAAFLVGAWIITILSDVDYYTGKK